MYQDAWLQFTQAIASGNLRGDELRTTILHFPRLVHAIARGLGLTVSELRELSRDGGLTTGRVFEALSSWPKENG